MWGKGTQRTPHTHNHLAFFSLNFGRKNISRLPLMADSWAPISFRSQEEDWPVGSPGRSVKELKGSFSLDWASKHPHPPPWRQSSLCSLRTLEPDLCSVTWNLQGHQQQPLSFKLRQASWPPSETMQGQDCLPSQFLLPALSSCSFQT